MSNPKIPGQHTRDFDQDTPPPNTETEDSRANAFHDVSHASAAFAFFESRPPPSPMPTGPVLVHFIDDDPYTLPGELRYQQGWGGARDVTRQDWDTFLVFLLPGHPLRSIHEPVWYETVKTRHAAAKMSAPYRQSKTLPRTDFATVIEQWNLHFFAPRKIELVLRPCYGEHPETYRNISEDSLAPARRVLVPDNQDEEEEEEEARVMALLRKEFVDKQDMVDADIGKVNEEDKEHKENMENQEDVVKATLKIDLNLG